MTMKNRFAVGGGYWWLLRCLNALLFGMIWPFLARLPIGVGVFFAKWIGLLCYRLDLDWRTVALREHYVARRTHLAMREILGGQATDGAVETAVRERFVCAAREELEGHWFALGRERVCECAFLGDEPVRRHLNLGQGAVLLTLHFDATLMGVAQLGLSGMRLNLMTSDVVEDARVQASVQRYFRRKYAGITRCLNGGGALHVESHLKSFYSGVRKGLGAVILGEAPTGRLDEALDVQFFAHRRAIAPGAVRLAEKMGCPLAAFVCLRSGVGKYSVVFSPLMFPEAVSGHQGNVQAVFSYLEARVRACPERWWAADQLPNFIVLDESALEESMQS